MLRLLAVFLAALGAACATMPPPPPANVADAAGRLPTYSADLSVKLGGRLRAPRTPVIVGFKRPDRLRLEMPSPGGARLILVARDGVLTAVFPRSRAVFQGPADRQVLGDITGVSLAPQDVMDFLTGIAPVSVSEYTAYWGPRLPRRVRAKLEDGTRLDVTVNDPAPGASLPERAFEPPLHTGYRRITSAEARDLWAK